MRAFLVCVPAVMFLATAAAADTASPTQAPLTREPVPRPLLVDTAKIDAALSPSARHFALDLLWLEPESTATPIISRYLSGLIGARLTKFQDNVKHLYLLSRIALWQMRDDPRECAYAIPPEHLVEEEVEDGDEEEDEDEDEEDGMRVVVSKQVLSKQKALLVAHDYFHANGANTYPYFLQSKNGTAHHALTVRVIVMIVDTSPREPSQLNPHEKVNPRNDYQCGFNDPTATVVRERLSLDHTAMLVIAADSTIKNDWDKLFSSGGKNGPFYRSLLVQPTWMAKHPEHVDDFIAAFIKEAAVRHAREVFAGTFDKSTPLSSELVLAIRPPEVSSSPTTTTTMLTSASIQQIFLLSFAVVLVSFVF